MGLDLLAAIVPPAVVVVETASDIDAPLHPAERDYVAGAVARRRAEFTTVRHCASGALGVLGRQRPVQVPGPRGEPAWPGGVVGSMTHCEGYRAAAVAPRTSVETIGVDAEPNAPLPRGVLERVASHEEARRVASLGAESPGIAFDRLLFSIKESVFKAWYPMERCWLGFEDADVAVGADGSFSVRLVLSGEPAVLSGTWRCSAGLVASALVVAAGGWRGRVVA